MVGFEVLQIAIHKKSPNLPKNSLPGVWTMSRMKILPNLLVLMYFKLLF